MVRYSEKGRMRSIDEDGTEIRGGLFFAASVDDDCLEPGVCFTATENIRSVNVKIPNTHLEVMKTEFADRQLEAEKVQLTKIAASNAMNLVPSPPKGTKILPGKQVYDLKQDSEGYILEFRARQVICGNRQTPSVDFQPDERYAPVASDAAAKLVISMAAIRRQKRA